MESKLLVSHRSRVITLATMTTAAILSCTDSLGPLNSKELGVSTKNPDRDMLAMLPFSGSLAGVGGSALSLPSFAFTEGVKVAMRIGGTIDLGSDSRAWYVTWSGALDAAGIFVGGVYNQCSLRASINYPTSPGSRTSFGPAQVCSVPRTMIDYVDTAVVRGDGTANRAPGIGEPSPGVCDTVVCHTYGGSQTITITPLLADLDMRGSYNGQTGRTIFVPAFTHTIGYYQVTFTDSASPRDRPLQPLFRSWRLGDPSDPGDSYWHHTDINNCPNGNPNGTPPTYPSSRCDLNVKESGVLTSRTRVNGIEHTDSACVQCATGDPTLDRQAVRTGMLEIADSTHGRATDLNLRREQVLAVLRNRTTGSITVITALQDSSNRCFSYWSPVTPADFPDDSLLAYVHTHPTVNNETYPCVNPSDSANRRPGPSTTDSATRASVNGRADYAAVGWNPTWYVMSMDGVYTMDATNSNSSHRSKAGWDKSLCVWIRFDARGDLIFRKYP
jgi:hypothetical protein